MNIQKAALALIVIATISGCGMQAESQVKAGAAEASKLFEVDGCRVYRFMDAGAYRYFTNCSGSTQWRESCGKNCTRETGIPGGGQQ